MAINGLVVCNGWNLQLDDLLNVLASSNQPSYHDSNLKKYVDTLNEERLELNYIKYIVVGRLGGMVY